MSTRILLYGDVHFGPTGETHDYERPELGEEFDAVVTIGDVIDDNVDHAASAADGEPYERRGRAFFEHLDGQDVPVVAVPGNHDPLDCTERLTEGLDNVVVAHEAVVTPDSFPGLDASFDGISFVGWGCEAFDVRLEFPYAEYPALDPRPDADSATIGHLADEAASEVESAVGRYLDGGASAGEIADEFGLDRADRVRMIEQFEALRESYQRIRAVVEDAPGEAVLCSHVSPFNTSFDYHHSFDDLAGRLHRGSIALKMAAAATGPLALFCGHVHQQGYDVIETVAGHRVAYNPGSPGVVAVEADPERGTVQVDEEPV